MIHIGYKDPRTGHPSQPNPKQEEAWQALRDENTEVLCAIGGTRGGKTSFAINSPLRLAMENPGQTWLLGHLRIADLMSSLVHELKWQCPESFYDVDTDDEVVLMQHDGKDKSYTITIPGYECPIRGYTIKFYYRPLDPEKKFAEKIARSGMTLNGAVLDQFELLDYASYMAVFTRVSLEPRKIILTMNPPDLSKIVPWYWDFLVTERRTENPGWERRRVVYMNSDDNQFISKNYSRGLQDNLSPSDAERLLHGSASHSKGLVYSELLPSHVVQPMEYLPPGSLLMEIGDWGFTDGAKTQFYVWLPERKKWRLWTSVKSQEEVPKVHGQKVLEMRYELLTAGRKPGDVLPVFIGSYWGRDIFSKMADGNTVAKQFLEIPAFNGHRLTPIKISNAGFDTQKGLIHSQIMRAKAMLVEELVEVSSECQDFLDQHRIYFYKPESEDPNEYRVKRGLKDTIEHHFEEMVCFRYFGWVARRGFDYSGHKQEVMGHNIPAHEFQHPISQRLHNPLARFQRKMNRVPARSY